METRPRPTTQTNSKTPLMPWLRWPVSERFQAIAELTDLVMTAAHSSGSDEQIFGPDSFRQDLGFLRAMTPAKAGLLGVLGRWLQFLDCTGRSYRVPASRAA